jgi:hypothetical protein
MARTNLKRINRELVTSLAPAHRRIAALAALKKPSLAFLRRIAGDQTAPGRLRALAVQRITEILAAKEPTPPPEPKGMTVAEWRAEVTVTTLPCLYGGAFCLPEARIFQILESGIFNLLRGMPKYVR